MYRSLRDIPTEELRAIERELHRQLGRRPRAAVWRQLLEAGLVLETAERRALELDNWAEDLADDYRKLDEGERADVNDATSPDEEDATLERILAAEASRDERVDAFRRRALRGRLVSVDRVEGWIERQAGRQKLAEFAQSTHQLVLEHGGDISATVELLASLTLEYVSLPDERERMQRVVPGSALSDLRRLSKQLSGQHGWTPAWAATFVLTGATPTFSRARFVVEGSSSPALERIKLDLSPRLAPKDVAEIYTRLRSLLRKPGFRAKARGGQSLALAVFVAEHNDGRRWDEARTAWNRARLGRSYPNARSFTTAARNAYEGVTGRRLEWRQLQREED